MRASMFLLGAGIVLNVACGGSANVEQERTALLQIDREWSQSVGDINKFVSYLAPEGSVSPPHMPRATGADQVRQAFGALMATPGVSVKWEPAKAEVSASGDIGYTTGAYESMANGVADKGKYVTVWTKLDGQWKVAEDIFNSDSGPAPTTHVMMAPTSLKWTDPPPGLPAGAKIAVVSGDPSKAAPFAIRVQVPAGYRVPPHWHPGDENLTILSGTVALGMGETWDDAKLQPLGTGGYAGLPGGMRHFFLARTAATFQVHGMGPLAITYVNPADDPRQKK